MSRGQLFVSARSPFTGISAPLEKSRFVVFGVPYDKTSTYRSGSRFAPGAIRDVSANLELYSVRSNVDLEKIHVHDMGDVDILESLDRTLERVSAVVSEIYRAKKVPIMLGGEHSITKASVEAFPEDLGVINFDAHMDLRDEFLGEKLSHATFMRRVVERLGPNHLMEVGIRAFSKPELDFTKSSNVEILTPQDIRKAGIDKTCARIAKFLSQFRICYVTVDIDVLDPAYAPGVGNPEPDGLSTDELLTLLRSSILKSLVGFDLVEVSPSLDSGQTAAVGAKVIFEAIAALSSGSP